MKSPTLPAPAIATRISGAPLRARARSRSASSASTRRRRSGGRRRPGRSRSACTTCACAEAGDGDEPEHAGLVQRRELLARPLRRDRAARRGTTLPLGSIQSCGCSSLGQQAAHHLVGRPRDGGDGRDAEPLVDQRPGAGRRCGRRRARCRSSRGRCGRERMFELSPLVTAANGAGPLDAGLGEVVAVEAEADDLLPAEVVGQPPEGASRSCRSPRPCGPAARALPASSLPTRPHPTTTTCTGLPPTLGTEAGYRTLRSGESPTPARPGSARIGHRPRRMACCREPVVPRGSEGTDDVAIRQANPRRPAARDDRAGAPAASRRRSRSRSSRRTRSRRPRTRPRRSSSSSRSARRASRSGSTRSSRSRSRSRSCSRSSSRRTARRSSPTRAAAAATSSAARTSARYPSLVAGASLLVDYILTVAVSISAGVAAIVSIPAFQDLAEAPRRARPRAHRRSSALANLRGIKESGRLFAVPDLHLHRRSSAALVSYGLFRSFVLDDIHRINPVPFNGGRGQQRLRRHARPLPPPEGLLVGRGRAHRRRGDLQRRARVPPARSRRTRPRRWCGWRIILGTLFFGVSVLAHHLAPVPEPRRRRCSRRWALPCSATAPLLRGPAVRDRRRSSPSPRTPPTPTSRGCRRSSPATATSRASSPTAATGSCSRTACSSSPARPALLIVAFGGMTNALIPLYAVGVFMSFTLSQCGHGAPPPEGARAGLASATS